ncbi:MAG: peptide chain release factor N(5)-glutamine methyltransferase [Desulfovibrio sp.]|nr:peptide chain release factor N(5)-glutamine methyltransferase [Desulfovibrio sp.]
MTPTPDKVSRLSSRLDRTLRDAADFLEKAGADSPRLTAEVLLAHACGLQRYELLKILILSPDSRLDRQSLRAARSFFARRARGEPTAYITGRKEFYGRDFKVGPEVLVPRPESELLVELALSEARLPAKVGGKTRFFADFGTGSGCLAATLSLELSENWKGLAMDDSEAALRTAMDNFRALGCAADRLLALLGDFHAPPLPPCSLDLLVCNPPYVSEKEYAGLAREVRRFEPKHALVPGRGAEAAGDGANEEAKGTEDAFAVIRQAEVLLRPGGTLLMETGQGQGKILAGAADRRKWAVIRVHKDGAGLDRALFGKLALC